MREANSGAPELRRIREVTYTVPDIAAIEGAYTRWLRYRVIERGEISARQATTWAAPALRGRGYVTLAPASGDSVPLRFITEPLARWRALTSHGWNVSEIVVQDVDALAVELRDSPFRVIGAPASLTRFPMIRAMQVIGPADECLYFTQVGDGSGLDLAQAESFVGRVFIVVAGGPDLPAMFETYAPFANEIDPPVATPVRVISSANDLPLDTLHAHGLVKLGHGSLIELDQYPAMTKPRFTPPGSLPSGMAIVSFEVTRPTNGTPVRGGAGELVDFVEKRHV
jgi:hypothetical protein